MSYYVDEPDWKNEAGETWSLERMVGEELGQTGGHGARGRIEPADGLKLRRRSPREARATDRRATSAVRKYVADFQTFALDLQNADGSWGPYFLAAKSTSPDVASQLRTTGRVLEWLAISLPDEKLADARVVRRGGVRRRFARQPALSMEHASAIHTGDCVGGSRSARNNRVRRACL